MKKIFVCLLAAMLVMTVLCAPFVMAEALEPSTSPAAPAAPVFTVNLTGLIVAILVAAFEFLLAWLMKAVIPPLKRWLESHTTKNQQQLMWNVVTRLVEAAEQTITGINQGKKKLQFVKSALQAHGYDVDTYMIEAAVKEMNDRALYEISHELNVETIGTFEDDSPGDDAEGEETE